MEIEGFLVPAGSPQAGDILSDHAAVSASARQRAVTSAWSNSLTFPFCEAGEWYAAIYLEGRLIWRSSRPWPTIGGERFTVELEAAAEFGSTPYKIETARRRGNRP